MAKPIACEPVALQALQPFRLRSDRMGKTQNADNADENRLILQTWIDAYYAKLLPYKNYRRLGEA